MARYGSVIGSAQRLLVTNRAFELKLDRNAIQMARNMRHFFLGRVSSWNIVLEYLVEKILSERD